MKHILLAIIACLFSLCTTAQTTKVAVVSSLGDSLLFSKKIIPLNVTILGEKKDLVVFFFLDTLDPCQKKIASSLGAKIVLTPDPGRFILITPIMGSEYGENDHYAISPSSKELLTDDALFLAMGDPGYRPATLQELLLFGILNPHFSLLSTGARFDYPNRENDEHCPLGGFWYDGHVVVESFFHKWLPVTRSYLFIKR